MEAAGFNVGGDPTHPICPIMIGDARVAAEFADEMLAQGIYVISFSYPVSQAALVSVVWCQPAGFLGRP